MIYKNRLFIRNWVKLPCYTLLGYMPGTAITILFISRKFAVKINGLNDKWETAIL